MTISRNAKFVPQNRTRAKDRLFSIDINVLCSVPKIIILSNLFNTTLVKNHLHHIICNIIYQLF